MLASVRECCEPRFEARHDFVTVPQLARPRGSKTARDSIAQLSSPRLT